MRLQQDDACFLAFFHGFGIPDAGLDLADVAGADHQHTQAALADAAADGVRQLTVQYGLVEGQGAAVVAASHGQLLVHLHLPT